MLSKHWSRYMASNVESNSLANEYAECLHYQEQLRKQQQTSEQICILGSSCSLVLRFGEQIAGTLVVVLII